MTWIGVGYVSSCAVVNGAAECWGDGMYGQLGDNFTGNADYDVPVIGLGSGVSNVAVGAEHACAVVNGGAQCWGVNGDGELGNGTTNNMTPAPVQVVGLTSGATALAYGSSSNHSCAIVNGGAQCWGENESYQLGDGTATQSSVPVQVSGLTSGVQAIGMGVLHNCALVSGGTLMCWGNNAYGMFGNGTTNPSSTPVAIPGLGVVEAVAVGYYHTCVIIDGGVQCWGHNAYGQLGNGTLTDSLTPVKVTGLGLSSGVIAIGAGYSHTCALKSDGTAACWGANGSGQLGDSSIDDSTVPVPVNPWAP